MFFCYSEKTGENCPQKPLFGSLCCKFIIHKFISNFTKNDFTTKILLQVDDTRKCFNPQLIIGNQFYLICFIATIIPTENIRKAEKFSRYFKGIYKDNSGMKCVKWKLEESHPLAHLKSVWIYCCVNLKETLPQIYALRK